MARYCASTSSSGMEGTLYSLLRHTACDAVPRRLLSEYSGVAGKASGCSFLATCGSLCVSKADLVSGVC